MNNSPQRGKAFIPHIVKKEVLKKALEWEKKLIEENKLNKRYGWEERAEEGVYGISLRILKLKLEILKSIILKVKWQILNKGSTNEISFCRVYSKKPKEVEVVCRN
ncbi:MAG: hypothetical protein ACP5KZ_01445 [bacterium]